MGIIGLITYLTNHSCQPDTGKGNQSKLDRLPHPDYRQLTLINTYLNLITAYIFNGYSIPAAIITAFFKINICNYTRKGSPEIQIDQVIFYQFQIEPGLFYLIPGTINQGPVIGILSLQVGKPGFCLVQFDKQLALFYIVPFLDMDFLYLYTTGPGRKIQVFCMDWLYKTFCRDGLPHCPLLYLYGHPRPQYSQIRFFNY